jgi:DegV family protein with EDD domain
MVRIITDSTCDLRPDQREALGVEVIPLAVHFGEESFRDTVDITNEEFYRRLSHAEKLPSTSQVNPEEFVDCFLTYVNQGDQVVGIFLSSAMSGTYQSAVIAKNAVGEGEIHLVDSQTVTFALALLVERAARLRDEGCSAGEIADAVSRLSGRMRLLAVVDTLKYLKMGGRINAATAVVGGLLGITPIITIEDGIVEAVGKARGRKAAFQWMAKFMETEVPDLTLPVAFGSSNAPDAMEECVGFFREIIGDTPFFGCSIGSVVGTHAGPGAVGIAYFVKEKA